jgi:hypothetical protein
MTSPTDNTTATASAQAAKPDALVLVMARNTFYYANAENLLKVAVGQFVLIVLMIAVLFRINDFTAARDYYFPVQTNDMLVVERPLYEPIFTDTELLDWTNRAIQATFTFGHYDYLTRLQEARAYYTLMGWASFTSALKQSTILVQIGAEKSDKMVGSKQVVTVALRPGTQPRLVRQGVLGGLYIWEVEADIDVTLMNETQQSRFSWSATLRVSRQPIMESRYGIGISSIVVRDPNLK